MNLLHRAMLWQQQARQNRHLICPACELPALFTYLGYGPEGEEGQFERWQCGNCATVMELSHLWPIMPRTRTSLPLVLSAEQPVSATRKMRVTFHLPLRA